MDHGVTTQALQELKEDVNGKVKMTVSQFMISVGLREDEQC